MATVSDELVERVASTMCGKCGTYLSAEHGGGMEPLDPQPTGDFEVITLGVLWCRACRPDLIEAQDKLRKGRE